MTTDEKWLLALVLALTLPGATFAQPCPHSILPVADPVLLGPEHVTGGEYRVLLDPTANDRSSTGVPLEIVSVEAGNPATGQLILNGDGTVTFRGQPGSVGARSLYYYLTDETGAQLAGAIAVQEGTAAPCVASAQLDSFTVPAGVSSHALAVLANDSTPGGCALPNLVPYLTPTGWMTTARGGQVWADVVNRRIIYSPPSLLYSGAADSFSYSAVGSVGDEATTSVTVHFSGQVNPAQAISSVLGRNGLLVYLDSFHSQASNLSCDPNPNDTRPEWLAAFIAHRCWSFGDGGSFPACDPVPAVDTYYVPSRTVLCVDANADGYHDPTGERCRIRYTAVQHTYAHPGEYAALLKITDSCGQEDTGGTQLDLRNLPPTARIAPQWSCWGLLCSFSGAPSTDDYGIVRYRWEFSHAGPPAEGRDIDHDFPALGSHQVALVVEDTHGASARTQVTVTLTDAPPVPAFGWQCTDLACLFTDFSIDDFPPLVDVRFEWRHRGLGTSGTVGVGSPAAFSVPVPGPYEFSVRVTDGAGQVRTKSLLVDVLGDLVAEPDWAALGSGQVTVDLPILENDRSPVGGIQIVAVKPPSFGTATLVGNVLRYTANSATGSLTDAFGYQVVDAAGNQAGGQIRVVRNPVAEVGRLDNLTTQRVNVKFAATFSEPPLVFALPASRVHPDAVSARVVQVTALGFTIFLQEPEGTADGGAHPGESITWFAVLPSHQAYGGGIVGGTGTLEGGALYAAGRTTAATHAGTAGGLPAWVSQRYPQPIVGPNVVVLAQTQTENDPSWVTVRVDEVTIEGFRMALQPREAALSPHGAETVAWLALPVGVFGGNGGLNFEAGVTGAVHTQTPRLLTLAQEYPRTPRILAGLTSARDLDPAVLRFRHTLSGAIELVIDEETSHEADLSHAAEKVAYLAFDEPGLLSGSRNALVEAEAGDLQVLDDGATFLVSATSGALTKVCPIENDSATVGPLELVWLAPPRYGTVRVSPEGMLLYQPAPGVCEDVEVPYGIRDGAGRRAYGTVYFRCGGVIEGVDFGEEAPSSGSPCDPPGGGGGEEL